MTTVICETDEKCKSILNDPSTCLKQLIYIKPISAGTVRMAQDRGIRVFSFEEIEKLGAEKKNRPYVIITQSLESCWLDQ